MWLKSRFPLLTVVLAGMMVLTACGTSSPSGTGGTGSANTSGNSSSLLLGIVSISPDEPGNARFIAGAEEVAKAKGWKVSVVDAHGSADQANAGVQDLVQRHAGAIIDMVFPVTSLRAGLLAAKQANIPVATWGGGMGDGVVAQDGDGGPMAQPIAEKLVSDLHGHGAVLALTYHTGQVCRERETVFDQVLAKAPGITVQKEEVHIPGYLQDGAQYATAWLAAHPKGSGNFAIWGCWDDPALGAVSALKQEGRTDVKTYGENGGPAAIAAIKAGSFTATYWEDSYQEGKVLVNTIQQAISAGSNWQPKNINVPGVVVDASNITQFLQQHPEALTGK